jgi:SAM-dependent methyltransferase
MKKCLQCQKAFESDKWQCPSCSSTPAFEGTIPLFAPALAEENDGFQSVSFELLFALEENNFWFKGRNELIIWAIERYFKSAKSFFEIGCGTGFVINGIRSRFASLKLTGSEIHRRGLNFARQRLPAVNLLQMDARAIPFANEFDLVGLFDVLEHIEEDEKVLSQIFEAVRTNAGGLILTVPQHKFLWSQADEFAYHCRRYSKEDLCRKVKKAGFEIAFVSSFVSLLLPLMLVSRLTKGNPDNYDPEAEFKIPAALNKALELVMQVERLMIKMGLRFPMGGSLLLVARVPNVNA